MYKSHKYNNPKNHEKTEKMRKMPNIWEKNIAKKKNSGKKQKKYREKNSENSP